MALLHYNDVSHVTVDELLMVIIPTSGGHLFFDSIATRLCERLDWQVTKETGESLAWEGLKRLQKAGKIVMGNHPNSPLFWKRVEIDQS